MRRSVLESVAYSLACSSCIGTRRWQKPIVGLRMATALIANNVVEFGMRFLDENDVDYVDFETITNDPYFTGTGPRPLPKAYFAPYSTESGRGMPEFADIYLRVLTEEGARLILRFEQGLYRADITTTNARNEFWRELEAAHSVEFRKRVQLRETGL